MRKLILALLFAPSLAWAQGAGPGQNVITGYIASSGCPAGQATCFIQYGAGGSGGGQLVTTPPLTYVTPDTVSVGTTSGSFAAAGKYTTSLQVCTLPSSSTNVWLNVRGAAAVVGAGVPVFSSGGCTNFGTQALPVPTAAINAITDSGSAQTVTVAGG